MDGFEGNEGIIIFAAANRSDVLGSSSSCPVPVDALQISLSVTVKSALFAFYLSH